MANRSVLYVEDDPVNVLLMQGILELHGGCQLLVARSGSEACTTVAERQVDLVLCDQHLPDAAGDQLLARLREVGLPTRVPAVLVTAEPGYLAATLAERGGFDAFWTKPLDVAGTLRSLERWLDR
ncbi:response regulator [Roseateles sp. DC23W]|uniref:Response regulator n=1 Tax=Pelomonas dachongensis TaxID=3299029 RepID=A0ABW7EH88_9BURK